jgi:iron-sulfur cluster assembly protein
MAITLTQDAIKAVKDTMSRQGLDPSSHYLRVGVAGGGCSGFSYSLGFTSEKNEDDTLFDCDGVQVVCDPSGLAYLDGTEIGYKDDVMDKGFLFSNPNASGSCGCGKSFSA